VRSVRDRTTRPSNAPAGPHGAASEHVSLPFGVSRALLEAMFRAANGEGKVLPYIPQRQNLVHRPGTPFWVDVSQEQKGPRGQWAEVLVFLRIFFVGTHTPELTM
jgi:hypothetical protein